MLVVTGMHRSGTSAVSMVLESLGVDFGPHEAFYAADEWNPRGYFERTDVIDVNSRLLTGVPRTTGRLTAAASQVLYLLVASRDQARRREQRLRPELETVAARLAGRAAKDPRFCLTLGAWASHVTRTVVVLRHPSAVVASLARRQRIPKRLGYRFWDRHAEGLLASTTMPTCFVDFDRLSMDPDERRIELRRLVAFLDADLDGDSASTAFEERFSARLRHFEPDPAALPVRTAALWEQLQARRLTPG